MSESTAHRRPATWVMTPFPSTRHSLTIFRLQNLLIAAQPPSLIAVSHVGWRVGRDEYGPDVMVVPATTADDVRFEGIPSLVIEVLSTNSAEAVRKLQKYARAGAPNYWIIDVRDRTLLALVLVDDLYEMAAQLDDDNPVAELDTGSGRVWVSLPDLLA